MREIAFEAAVAGGIVRGHRGEAAGPPALLLHGGPALPDYLDDLAQELGSGFSTVRYTQAGTPPSAAEGPYTVESHAADAVAVLDALGIEQAWAIGHSWGGFLALQLALLHPERLLGVIAVGALGAYEDDLAALGRSMRAALTPQQEARVDAIEQARRDGTVSEADLIERWAMVWPRYFADPAAALPAPSHVGVECSRQTNVSLSRHFAAGTLVEGLPSVRLPVLFVHGTVDPLPPTAATRTAALITGAMVELVEGCGHFPWIERPGSVAGALNTAAICGFPVTGFG
jgi:pimeloyl-ACP methyl ester carboxylesterase